MLTLHSDDTRRDLEGPEVFLGPKAGPSVSLLLHELATNANKYGSLSNDVGRVSGKWLVEDVDDVPTLTIIWSESGGPTVIEPTRRGFGSRLIRMGIAGAGHVEMNYLPDGFTATFKAPIFVVLDISS